MGNTNKKEEQIKKNDNDIKINHEKFSHFVYHEPEDLIEITLEAESEKDINRWDQDLKRINSFQDKETLMVPNKHQYKSKGFCGNVGSVKIFYQNYPYLFQEEIENRIEMGKHFEEEELWYLLYSLCSSARDFSRIDSKIGDVRPYNIFINEQGQIKIANLYSWPYERTNFDKTAFERQLTYLSPEEMRLISKGNHENTTNKVTSQSFSIGLTLLQSGLLFNAKQLYSIEHFSVDLDKLSNKITQWMNSRFVTESNNSQSYSPLLKNIVAGLCHPDDRERLRSLQVQEALRPHQNQILNLKEFDHQHVSLPVKVEQFSQQQPLRQEAVQNRPGPIELGYKETKTYQSVPPPPPPSQGTMINVNQQKVYVANPLEPKLNSSPPPPSQTYTETVRPVSGHTSVRFGQGQPVNVDFLQGQFTKYASNQPQTNYRPPTIPVQSYQQQFTKYSTLSGNQSSGITIPPAGTNTVTFTQGGNNTFNYNRQHNTLNQPTGLPTTIPTFQPPSTNYQSNTNTFKEFTTTTSTFSKPVSTYETTTKVSSSIPVASNDGSSDFLKKIDEQLQASRRQFPS